TVLNDNVEEIMSKTLISVPHTETLRNTVQIMFDSGISGIPLVKGSKPVGIFTEKDVILLNQLWSSEIDTLITSEDSIGRSIDEKHVLTNNHSIWQATDKFIQLSQRQILVKRANTQEFIGIITITKVLEALASKLLLIESEDTNINILHTTTIDHIELYPVLQRGLPILVSSIRIWLNSRGIEATPLYSMGKPLKLVTEKDLFGYLISRLNSE
ncbi:MAG: CBS domain-containing protein, partial [Candidatus Heimdallarchaeota archaeon]|nr:CBS domain-containing protein [Candidatus Heimdallarchaeota archaeon]